MNEPVIANPVYHNYVYGIDLAQTLNFAGIIVLDVSNTKVRIKTARKYQHVIYPQIKAILHKDLFPRFPPSAILVDYTSEKSFSEELEASLNPSFNIPNSDFYLKWKYVKPVIFSQASKLEMKQNSKNFMQQNWFDFPIETETHPLVWELVKELKEQMQRESAEPSGNGQLSFPKPEGQDNDLAMACELALLGAKEFFGPYANTIGVNNIPYGGSVGLYSDYVDNPDFAVQQKTDRIVANLEKVMRGSSISGVKVNKHDL